MICIAPPAQEGSDSEEDMLSAEDREIMLKCAAHPPKQSNARLLGVALSQG